MTIDYKGRKIERGFRLDLIAHQDVVLELKAVAEIHPIHVVQTISYLKASGLPVALLLNFGEQSLRYRRILNPERAIHVSPTIQMPLM